MQRGIWRLLQVETCCWIKSAILPTMDISALHFNIKQWRKNNTTFQQIVGQYHNMLANLFMSLQHKHILGNQHDVDIRREWMRPRRYFREHTHISIICNRNEKIPKLHTNDYSSRIDVWAITFVFTQQNPVKNRLFESALLWRQNAM